MQHWFKLLCGGIGVACLLSACASTPQECDPHQDQGFFGKIGCLTSGSYEQRVAEKEQYVEDLKAENQRLNQLVRQINDQNSALLLGDYSTRQRELDKIRGELYSVQRSLEQKKALDQQLQNKLKQANAQLNDMQRSSAAATIKEKQEQIAELEKVLDELSQQMLQTM